MKFAGMMVTALLLVTSMVRPYAQTGRRPPAPVPASRDQDSVKMIGKLEDEMRLASLKGNAAWWVENLSDGYVETDSTGKVSNKAEVIELRRSNDMVYEAMNISERTVHMFNGDTVIVTGKLTVEGTYRGQSFSGDYQITRVWVRMGLEWKLASSQATKTAP